MEPYILTINADKRYYLSEDNLEGGKDLIETIGLFNDYKMDLYNQLFDSRFHSKGPLVGQTYSRYLKGKYSVNDYYACAIYGAASGAVSSQWERNVMNIRSLNDQIKVKQGKIASAQKGLDKKRQIKASIVTYVKTGKWNKPYPQCKLKVSGKTIVTYQKKKIPLDCFERTIEADIRFLKKKLSNLKFGLDRSKKKLEKMAKKLKKIVFGSRVFYSKKDQPDTDIKQWKKEFNERRHHSMSLPGRHTSKVGNFLAAYDLKERTLTIRCMNGRKCVFKDFQLVRYQDVFLSKFDVSPKERESICYNFKIEKDEYGRTYIIPSVTMSLPVEGQNCGFSNGCVSVDLNVDHVAVSNIDARGYRLESFTVPFDLKGKTSGQISDILGRKMSIIGAYCEKVKKCLVIEDLDTTGSKSRLQYGSKLRNRKISSFAYKKMTESIRAQGYKRNFAVYKVPPEYTSQIGKLRYMRQMGLSIHEAASYVIGLVGMGKTELLSLPPELEELLPESAPQDLKKRWAMVSRAFKNIRTHAFYQRVIPADWSGRKKKGLKNYAAILKEKDDLSLIPSKA